MKRLTYFAALVFAAGAIFAGLSGVAHAQATNPQWRVNVPSSTITPINPSLQVPCANVQGGCSSGGVSPTSTNNFTVPQNFSGISNVGSVTSTAFQSGTSTASSSINNLNGNFNIPANYATIGCPWNTSITDLGGCVMAAYLSASSTASASNLVLVRINIPHLPQFTQYNTKINFNVNGLLAELDCAPGQILQYTGATTATSGAITYNDLQATSANLKISQNGGSNCHFAGGSSLPTTATTTGIYIGGSIGEANLSLYDFGAFYFGTGWATGSSTYMLNLYNPVSDGNIQNWNTGPVSNSGESINLFSPRLLDEAVLTASNLSSCVMLSLNGNTEFTMYGPSIDDCGMTITAGNESVTLNQPNLENAAALTNTSYPAYPYITINSSTATNVVINQGTLQFDAMSATSSPTSSIIDGGSLAMYGTYIGRNGNQTVKNLVDLSQNPGVNQFQEQGVSAAASAVTNMVSTTAAVYPVTPQFNSGPTSFASTQSGGNITLTALSPTVTYFTNASHGTSTLPKVSLSQGEMFILKSRGTASVLVNANTSTPDFIWDLNKNASSTGYTLFPGSSVAMYNDGTYWLAFAGAGPQWCTPYVDQVTGNTVYVYVSSTVVTASTTIPLSCQ